MIVANAIQNHRLLTLRCPLGENALLLRSFSMTEEISSLFTMQLELASEEARVPLDAILGKPVAVHVEPEVGTRHFHGIVSRFGYTGNDDRFHYYYAEVVPWLWLLTRSADCRVFQNLTVPQIVEKVFRDRGFTDFKPLLKRKYSPLDYCVQYRETDFNFVSRLMEEEGIFYFFEHHADRHVLVLGDSPMAHSPCPGQTTARFEPNGGTGMDEETVTFWQEEQELRTGKYSHRDYHFQLPDRTLESSEPTIVGVKAIKELEVYDYPSEYAERFSRPEARLDQVEPEGRLLAKIRMEEEEATHVSIRGSSSCRHFAAGCRFDLLDYPSVGDTSGPYLLTSIQHSANQGSGFFSGGGGGGTYTNNFSAIPHATPYRPRRVTRRPFVQGPQTAVVVGPQGEEIFVDKFGRVKVQFFWDREGKKNDESSCFVRVAQSVAGKRWGSYFWPRIGQEVVVDFLEGNPDQPIITGCVYNAHQMPPYLGDGPDPNHRHDPRLSGIKTNSTKGGNGFNELRFDDTRDKEQVFLHAQNRKDERVGGSSFESVGGERHLIVEGDRCTKIGGDDSIVIEGFNSMKVNGFEAKTIEGDEDFTVNGTKADYVGGSYHEVVKGDHFECVDTGKFLNVGGSYHMRIGANCSIQPMNFAVEAKEEAYVGAATYVVLKAGGGFIEIGPGGIRIEGKSVKINCGGGTISSWAGVAIAPEESFDATPNAAKPADGAKTGQPSAPDAVVIPRKPAKKPERKPAEYGARDRHALPHEKNFETPNDEPPGSDNPVPPVGGA